MNNVKNQTFIEIHKYCNNNYDHFYQKWVLFYKYYSQEVKSVKSLPLLEYPDEDPELVDETERLLTFLEVAEVTEATEATDDFCGVVKKVSRIQLCSRSATMLLNKAEFYFISAKGWF